MSDLRTAILDAKYIEMIGLADFIVKDCALPDVDAEGNLVSGQTEIAAAIFRWAMMQTDSARPVSEPEPAPQEPASQPMAPPTQAFQPMPVNE